MIRLTTCSALTVLALAACGDDDAGATRDAAPPSDAPPGTDASGLPPIVIEGRLARYDVPVTDAELAPFAQYQVTDAEWTITSRGDRKLQYTLPADLVGTPQLVELEGPDSGAPWSLTGEVPGTTADCVLDGPHVVCTEHLPGIVVDLPMLEARVAAGTLAPERLRVAQVFAPDPIGILRFAPP
ncbi:MAG: hypothetical protein IT379_35050 [Deltaproteobacteria bacterium]|nr:hypothetical protein [Deltaproteobacteria bacterium]